MTYRPQPKYATKDAHRGPWTTCDRCGLIWNQTSMQFQYDFNGGPLPVNRQLLFCPRCLDAYNYQKQLIVIPPDPPPLMNTRPEPYSIDETNWLTVDGNPLEIASDTMITSVPNPDDPGDASDLTTDLPD